MSDGSRSFFDGMGEVYSDAIARCVPRYEEMLEAVLLAVPEGMDPRRMLELGCGSGNLSLAVVGRYPAAHLHMVDLSPVLVEACRARIGEAGSYTWTVADIADLRFEAGAFDLVLSSIALHHLEHDGKRALFRHIRQWLSRDGVFVFADQFAGATADVTAKHMHAWREGALRKGVTPEEWDAWMAHQRDHDHHATLAQQSAWIVDAGFETWDVTWRHLLWTVMVAT